MKNPQQWRVLAERLVVFESAKNISSATKLPELFSALEKFRPALATLMGNLGFRSLVARALVLASAEVAFGCAPCRSKAMALWKGWKHERRKSARRS